VAGLALERAPARLSKQRPTLGNSTKVHRVKGMLSQTYEIGKQGPEQGEVGEDVKCGSMNAKSRALGEGK